VTPIRKVSSVCGVMTGILGFNFTMVFDIHDYTFDLSLAPFLYLFPKAADTTAYVQKCNW
jgi:hypothetical protein